MSRRDIPDARNIRIRSGSAAIENRWTALIVGVVLGGIVDHIVVVGVGNGDSVEQRKSQSVIAMATMFIAVAQRVRTNRERAAGTGSESTRAQRSDAGRRAVNRAPAKSGRSDRRRGPVNLRLARGNETSRQHQACEKDRSRNQRSHINMILRWVSHGTPHRKNAERRLGCAARPPDVPWSVLSNPAVIILAKWSPCFRRT